ncbi:ATP-binding protein [Deinococcus pimensis]|uniref:ATP-binding protein n=1 Tax=Deinococcus pimensis TaxID=309888 RepID=UPI0004B8804D|nr:DUF87 domain-containing protein [Deinococcus pimensis]
MQNFFERARYQDSPLRMVSDFLRIQDDLEAAKEYERMRFVGYVLEIGYDKVTIITSDPYKIAVGGVPRGSFLIMVPDNIGDLPPHFTLLRVRDTAETPLKREVQQTYFELHKKSMPEIDRWTQGELQWGALETSVLGMFYPDPRDENKVAFSGDVNNVVSAHRYKIYSPDQGLLDLIVNGLVSQTNRWSLGRLRSTECELTFDELEDSDTPVNISVNDIKGFRTALFGKTRLGKSNIVKLIVQSVIESTRDDRSVGQLIFDVNGEYANTNEQNIGIKEAYPETTEVYALTQRASTPSSPLRLNFYEQPESCIKVLSGFLSQDRQMSNYIRSFGSVTLPSVSEIQALPQGERDRLIRKLHTYWAILHRAGFESNTTRLQGLDLRGNNATTFNPHYSVRLREAAYAHAGVDIADPPRNLEELASELEVIANYRANAPRNAVPLRSTGTSGEPIFDSDDIALLDFLSPQSGTGPGILRAYRGYHSPTAADFEGDIMRLLDNGMTVILDLGSASDEIRQYFSDMLSRAVFRHQEAKFVENRLQNHYIQLYFEEAHNLFPKDNDNFTGVYARFAKEGAKFHIGMVYSTQSPSTINRELLVQTENFFVGHIPSKDELRTLTNLQVAFEDVQQDIMKSRSPGFMRMITFSHRYIIPVQARHFRREES